MAVNVYGADDPLPLSVITNVMIVPAGTLGKLFEVKESTLEPGAVSFTKDPPDQVKVNVYGLQLLVETVNV
jgi:hypothetical protein